MPSLPFPSIATALRAGLAAVVLGTALTVVALPSPAIAQGLPDFTELVEKVGPAVVNIRTTERARVTRSPGADPDEDSLDLLRRFGFPDPAAAGPARSAARRRRCGAARHRLGLHPHR